MSYFVAYDTCTDLLDDRITCTDGTKPCTAVQFNASLESPKVCPTEVHTGDPSCKCRTDFPAGFLEQYRGQLGGKDCIVYVTEEHGEICLPLDYGLGECEGWETRHPSCTNTNDAEAWCFDAWCWVDETCLSSNGEGGTQSAWFPDVAITYSYHTCAATSNEEQCTKSTLPAQVLAEVEQHITNLPASMQANSTQTIPCPGGGEATIVCSDNAELSAEFGNCKPGLCGSFTAAPSATMLCEDGSGESCTYGAYTGTLTSEGTKGDDGACPAPCKADEHVVSNVCTACAEGKTRNAGDPVWGPDTTCNDPGSAHFSAASPILLAGLLVASV